MSKYNFYIIGSGLQGASAASILSKLDFSDKIILGDINFDSAVKVSRKIGSDKVIPLKVDASNIDSLCEVDEDVDVVLNFTNPRFNINIMKTALKLSAHYLDTASGPDLDLNPIDYMVSRQFELDYEFKDARLKALISCGYTPGLSNVIARLIIDRLIRVDRVKFRAAYSPIIKADPFTKLFNKYSEIMSPTWSPEVSFLYRATNPVTYENGMYIRHPPFSEPEVFKFPDPIGETVTVLVDHEEPVTLPRFIKGLKYVDYKNAPDIIAYALIKIDFTRV